MKKIFQYVFLIGLVFRGTLAKAQDTQTDSTSEAYISKGKILISSIFNFSFTNTANNRTTGVNYESKQSQLGGYVGVGKMFSDHWGVLIDLGSISTTTSTPTWINGALDNLSVQKIDYSLVPMIRYYKSIDESVYFFVQAAAAASVGTLESNELSLNNKVVHYSFSTHGYNVGISPGFSYFINSKLSSEMAIGLIGYSYYHGSDNLGNNIKTTSAQSLIYLNSISLGFVLYLSRSGKK